MPASRRDFLRAAAAAAPLHLHAAPRRPNFLFLFPDQHRYDWVSGVPDIPVRTPHLDSLATRGVRFSKAFVASPLCAPSRACLAAGKEYDRCRVRDNGDNYPLDQTTYYSLLRNAGYHVAACGKVDLHKATKDWGLDGKRLLPEWGFSDGIDNEGKGDAIASGAVTPKGPYMAYLHRRQLAAAHVEDFRKRSRLGYAATWNTPLPEEAYCDNWLANNGLSLLRAVPKGHPWHLVVNFTGPHNPMDITARMDKLCRGRDYRQPNGSLEFTPEIHNTIRQNYTAMVENIDRLCGLFLDEVRRRGELDNTIVVYSSDHGEMLGDHNRWHKSVPYQESVGVPLIIGGPGVKQGLRSNALVSHIDIAATFLDYAGVPIPRDMDARSLRPLLEGKTQTHRQYLLSGLNKWRLAFDGRYKLITGFDAAPNASSTLLFDLDADPAENRDIAQASPAIVKRLSALLPKA
jgi:arylsulfatase A-like enzyme